MKNKIKIYFFHPYSGYGGADLSISRLINGLDDKNFLSDLKKIRAGIDSSIKYDFTSFPDDQRKILEKEFG